MTVRDAGPDDLGAVAALERACLGVDAWPAGLIEEGLRGKVPTTHYLVAGEPVAGHAVVAVAGDIAELQRIAVDETQRRAGIASELLAAVVTRGRREGADRLLLEVRTDNRDALAFYTARGFAEIDRRPRYYADGADAIVMRLPLTGSGGGWPGE